MSKKYCVFFLKNKLRRENGKYRIDVGFRLYKAVKKELGNKLQIFIDGPEEGFHLSVAEDVIPIIFNWGVSSQKNKVFIEDGIYINHPINVSKSVNKIETLKALSANCISTPQFTTDKEAAYRWAKGYTVLARTTVTGKGGEGIVVINPSDRKSIEEFPDAPLYTRYWKKTEEYRLHVFNDRVIDIQQKKRMSEEKLEGNALEYNSMIRSWNNGWVFTREGVVLPDVVKNLAVRAVNQLNLVFGAVDMLVASDKNTGKVEGCVVCEVNSSPGMEGTTLENYTKVISEYLLSFVEKKERPKASSQIDIETLLASSPSLFNVGAFAAPPSGFEYYQPPLNPSSELAFIDAEQENEDEDDEPQESENDNDIW